MHIFHLETCLKSLKNNGLHTGSQPSNWMIKCNGLKVNMDTRTMVDSDGKIWNCSPEWTIEIEDTQNILHQLKKHINDRIESAYTEVEKNIKWSKSDGLHDETIDYYKAVREINVLYDILNKIGELEGR